jgi:hypothetical protein
MIKKSILIFACMIFVFGVLATGIISSVDSKVCCEKTDYGAYCMNEDESNCDISVNPETGKPFRKTLTSCETTAYCQSGTCINTEEGNCDPNVAQRTCQERGGTWDQRVVGEIDQCAPGCCILGDSTSFVTQTNCKKQASDYGVSISFRTDIKDELSCIALSGSTEKGACVLDDGIERNCIISTREDCQTLGASPIQEKGFFDFGSEEQAQISYNVEFNEGLLCSAEELNTICGKSEKTTCLEGESEVYFLDTCGNLANIYDSSNRIDQDYWSNMKDKSESCNANDINGNANSASCGNCDYLSGSTCKAYNWQEDTSKPNIGNNICRDLSCNYEGETKQHGESWCISSDDYQDLPGSRYYRMLCYDREVLIEECEDYRQQYCEEIELVEGYTHAECKVNMWQDCYSVPDQENCEDYEQRDCYWIEGQSYTLEETANAEGSCVPFITPGFDFWTSGEKETLENEDYCGIGITNCVVQYEVGIFRDRDKITDKDLDFRIKHCVGNCHCIDGYVKGEFDDDKFKKKDEANYDEWESYEEWRGATMGRCTLMGDCGVSDNYAGYEGYNNLDDVLSSEFFKVSQKGEIKG